MSGPAPLDASEPERADLAAWLVRWRWALCAAAALACALVAALGIPRLEFEVGHRSLFVEGDEALARYDQLERVFGSDDTVMALVEVEDAFAEPHLSRLLALGERLRALPFVTELRSPLHSPVVFEEDEAITSRSVAAAAPADEAARALWRARVLGYEPFAELLVSRDGRQAAFLLRLDPDPRHRTPGGRAAVADALLSVSREGPWADYPMAVVGTPLVTTRVARILGREMVTALASGMAVAALALLACLRSARAALAPLAVIAATLLATFGLMGLAGSALSTLSAILITLAICVGVADAMHLVASHQRLVREGLPQARALAAALREVWLPCLFTSVTTIAGFLSLLTSHIAPVRTLGVYCALAGGIAFVALLALVPALVGAWRPGPNEPPPARPDALPRALEWLVRLPPLPTALAGLLVIAAALPGLGRLTINQNLLRDLAPDEPLRRDLEFVHARMGGTVAAEVVIEPLTPPPDGIPSAALLREVAAFEAWLSDAHPAVKVVRGLPDGLAEVHRVWGGPREVPADDALAAQLLLLLQSSDPEFCDAHVSLDGALLRVTARLDLIDSRDYQALLATVEQELARRFAGLARGHVTGGAMLLARSNAYLLATQLDSFGLALALVLGLIALWSRDLRLGLFSMLVNVLPIAGVLGMMGWLGFEMTTANALIATLAIGIVVDDTIHITHALREAQAAERDPENAVRHALAHAGLPILFTTLVLAGSFGTYVLSDLASIRNFGAIAGVTFVAALLADLVLLPALLRLGRS